MVCPYPRKYNPHPSRFVPRVREESLDWEVFHTIATAGIMPIEEVADRCEITHEEAMGSVERLSCALLVKVEAGSVQALSFQESLLRCQARYDPAFALIFEGGLVRVRNPGQESGAETRE